MPNASICVVAHTANPRLGWLADYIPQLGGDIQIIRAFEEVLPDPQTLTRPVVVLGGPMGVADIPHLSWLSHESQWIAKLLEKDHPLLGICLGAQLMAHVLVHRVSSCEMGSMECGYYPTTKKPGWFGPL